MDTRLQDYFRIDGRSRRFYNIDTKGVPGLESLYVHAAEQLSLGVYVDDFRISGKAEFMHKSWEDLKKHIDFGEITSLKGGGYSGCIHKSTEISDKGVEEKRKASSVVLSDDTCTTAEGFQIKPIKLALAQKRRLVKELKKGSGDAKKARKTVKNKDSADLAMALTESVTEPQVKRSVKGWFY